MYFNSVKVMGNTQNQNKFQLVTVKDSGKRTTYMAAHLFTPSNTRLCRPASARCAAVLAGGIGSTDAVPAPAPTPAAHHPDPDRQSAAWPSPIGARPKIHQDREFPDRAARSQNRRWSRPWRAGAPYR